MTGAYETLTLEKSILPMLKKNKTKQTPSSDVKKKKGKNFLVFLINACHIIKLSTVRVE